MSNESIKPTKDDAGNSKKLPKFDESVEELPGDDLDEVAGGRMPVGFTDCKGTGCQGSSSVA